MTGPAPASGPRDAPDASDGPPVVEEVRVSGAEAARAVVVLSDGASFTMAVETVVELGVRKGEEVGPELRTRLEDVDLRFRAREKALSLLARRPRSRRELADRLRRADVPADVRESVLDRLEASGYLDDAEFARAFIRDRLRFRPRGRRALATELRKKGVGREEIDRALDDAFEEMETSDREVADEVADGWLRRQRASVISALRKGPFTDDGGKAWRRGLSHMARKGFGAGVARGALERALEEAGAG